MFTLIPQPTFLVELSKVLANPGNTQVARVAAGLQVKNSLTSKDPDVKTQYQQRWLAIDANARREIKNYVRTQMIPPTFRVYLRFNYMISMSLCLTPPHTSVFFRFYRLWARRRTGPVQRRSASQGLHVQRFLSTSGPSWSHSWWPMSPTPPAPNTWRSPLWKPLDTSVRTSWVNPHTDNTRSLCRKKSWWNNSTN